VSIATVAVRGDPSLASPRRRSSATFHFSAAGDNATARSSLLQGVSAFIHHGETTVILDGTSRNGLTSVRTIGRCRTETELAHLLASPGL
jgi:hypothetical protein